MTWRQFLWAFVVSVLASTLLVGVAPVQVEAAATGEYRALLGLDFDTVRDVEVSEEHNRVAISGDNRVDIYTIDSLSLLVSIAGISRAGEMQIVADRLYSVDGDNGVVAEIDLVSGVQLRRWNTNQGVLRSIAVSTEYVWFGHGASGSDAGVGRISLATGAVEELQLDDYLSNTPLVRVSPSRPNDLFVAKMSTGYSVWRYEINGSDLTLAETWDGRLASGERMEHLRDFVVSQDGASVWVDAKTPSRVFELDSETLREAERTYPNRYATGVDHDGSSRVAVTTGAPRMIDVYDQYSVVAMARFGYPGTAYATALSESMVVAVAGSAEFLSLHVWTLDYVETPTTVTVSLDRHGWNRQFKGRMWVSCDSFSELIVGVPGQVYEVVIPASERRCLLIHEDRSARSIFFGTRSERGWQYKEGTRIEFDPVLQPRVGAFVRLESPANNFALFLNQHYIDVAGRRPTESEEQAAGQRIASGAESLHGFVVNLMNSEGRYEQTQAPISRLYRAFFLRDPEMEGIEYWSDLSAGGRSTISIAEYFAAAPEFDQKYGSLDDREFIRLVYRNVMSREPDQAGYDYWIARMVNGMTRGELMLYFSDSSEYRGYTSDRVFVVYAVRTLERRSATAGDIAQLLDIHSAGGREAVVGAILAAGGYDDRFWNEPDWYWGDAQPGVGAQLGDGASLSELGFATSEACATIDLEGFCVDQGSMLR